MTEFFGYFDIGPIDILGFFAGACLLSSVIARKLIIIKILLLIGSLSWLTYGLVRHLLPVVTINTIISLTGMIEVTRLLRARKRAEIGAG